MTCGCARCEKATSSAVRAASVAYPLPQNRLRKVQASSRPGQPSGRQQPTRPTSWPLLSFFDRPEAEAAKLPVAHARSPCFARRPSGSSSSRRDTSSPRDRRTSRRKRPGPTRETGGGRAARSPDARSWIGSPFPVPAQTGASACPFFLRRSKTPAEPWSRRLSPRRPPCLARCSTRPG